MRLLILGHSVPLGELAVLGAECLSLLREVDLVEAEGELVRATARVSPWLGLLMAGDRVDRRLEVDWVIPPEESATALAKFVTPLLDQPPMRVLDLGCGGGALALVAARAGHHVVGIDLNARAVDFARRNAATNRLSAEFMVGSAADAGRLAPGQFDLVLFNFPGLFELSTSRAVATGLEDAAPLLEAVMTSLPSLLTDSGIAVLRHEELIEPRTLDLVWPAPPGPRPCQVVRVGWGRHFQGISGLESGYTVVRRGAPIRIPIERVPAWPGHDVTTVRRMVESIHALADPGALRPRWMPYVAILEPRFVVGGDLFRMPAVVAASSALRPQLVLSPEELETLIACDGSRTVEALVAGIATGAAGGGQGAVRRLVEAGVIHLEARP